MLPAHADVPSIMFEYGLSEQGNMKCPTPILQPKGGILSNVTFFLEHEVISDGEADEGS